MITGSSALIVELGVLKEAIAQLEARIEGLEQELAYWKERARATREREIKMERPDE